jgi:hypothetical protein
MGTARILLLGLLPLTANAGPAFCGSQERGVGKEITEKCHVVPLAKEGEKPALGKHEIKLNELEMLIAKHALAVLNQDSDALLQLMVYKDGELADRVRAKSALKSREDWTQWLKTMGALRKAGRTPMAILIPPKSGEGPVCVCCSYYVRSEGEKSKESIVGYAEINLAEKIEGVGWKILQP